MNLQEFRQRVYGQYFETLFRSLKANQANEATFRRARKSFSCNYDRYLRDLPDGARVLDVGCGVGHCLFYLRSLGFSAEGVDLSKSQLEQAATMLPRDVLHCSAASDFLQAAIGKYDAITANDLLEHMTAPEALELLDQVYAALKPNGRVLVRVPNAAALSASELLYGDVTHQRAYTESSIAQLLSTAGFQRIRVSRCEPPIRTPLHVVPWLFRRMASLCYKLRLFLQETRKGPRIVSRTLIACGWKPEKASAS